MRERDNQYFLPVEQDASAHWSENQSLVSKHRLVCVTERPEFGGNSILESEGEIVESPDLLSRVR